MKSLRRINAYIAALLLIIIILHGLITSTILLRLDYTPVGEWLGYGGLALLVVHGIIGIILTVQTIVAEAQSRGKLYLRMNASFWTCRLTGLAMILLMFFHIGMFGEVVNGEYENLPFTTIKMIATMALAASVFLHIFTNVRPNLISLGILTDSRERRTIYVVLAVILVFIAIAIVDYYISWWF